MYHFKPGDRVKTRYKFVFKSGSRACRRFGTVEFRNGMYVYVKLDIGYSIESFDTELVLQGRTA